MYLANPDLRPTGYEPAEFIDAPAPAGSEGGRRETPPSSDRRPPVTEA